MNHLSTKPWKGGDGLDGHRHLTISTYTAAATTYLSFMPEPLPGDVNTGKSASKVGIFSKNKKTEKGMKWLDYIYI